METWWMTRKWKKRTERMKIRALIGMYKVGVKIIRIELASGKPVMRRERNIFFVAV